MDDYLNEFLKFAHESQHRDFFLPDQEVLDFYDFLSHGELVVSVSLPKLQKHNTSMFWMRAKNKIGFISPTLVWAQTIKDLVGDKKVLEIISGTGLLAKYLSAVGVDLTATDNMSWHNDEEREISWDLYFPVETLDFRDAIKKYPADFLLMCYPYMDSLAVEAAKLYTKLNPNGLIIYIGEWDGGCCASEEFFEDIEIVDKMEDSNKLFPLWYGLNDAVSLVRWVK